MASLKQIAEELGISSALVSKVVSGRMGTSRTSDKTRNAILNKAKELNYTPNSLAVALRAGRKATIGIFFHHMGIPGSDVSDRLLRGFAEALEQSSYRMLLRFFTTDVEFIAACDTELKKKIDGLIIAGVFHPELQQKIRELEREKVPVVLLSNSAPGRHVQSGITHVVVNYESQGYLATRHLIEQGCRQIACFSAVESRTVGYVKAHDEAKLKLDRRLVIPTDGLLPLSGKKSLEELLAKKLPFDGIVCHSDAQANAAINGLITRGIRVPEEIKVTGVDNSPLTEDCIVPITSVTPELRASGLKTVNLLLQRIAGKRVKSVLIEPSLVVRRSSGGRKSEGTDFVTY
ncbi:MAG: LacI family DNA-binding transcriptional regulator [Chthoniobacteraceae bacterium]